MSNEIQIRRAKRGDLAAIAALVKKATRSKIKMEESDVMEWLFGKGMWVAVQGETLVGVAACQTENLVAVTDVLYIAPAKLRTLAGKPLLAALEAELDSLMCEVNILLLPEWTPKTMRTFLQKQGYEAQTLDDLHRIWREVLSGFDLEGRELMVKRLRERMIMAPL